jgi:hypothetical protein
MEINLLKNIRTNFKIYDNDIRKSLNKKIEETGITQYPAENLLDKLIEYLNMFPKLVNNIDENSNDYYDPIKAKVETMFLAISVNEGISDVEQKKYIDIFEESYEDKSTFSLAKFIEKVASSEFYNNELMQKIAIDSIRLGIGGTRINIEDLELESSKRLLLPALDISTLINYEMLSRSTEYLKKKQVELDLPKQMTLFKIYSKEELDFVFKQWKEFKRLSDKKLSNSSDISMQDGKIMLHEGDLLHGIGRYGQRTLESIAKIGIVSGEFIGITEDSETFACADFYRTNKDKSLEEELKEIKGGESKFPNRMQNTSDRVAFVIQKSDLEKYESLTDYDPYLDTEKGRIARKIANGNLPLGKENSSSIIVGLPSSAISMIVVDKNLEQNEEKIKFLLEQFPSAAVVSTLGTIIAKNEKAKTLDEKQENLREKLNQIRILEEKIMQAEQLKEESSVKINNEKDTIQ